MKQNEKMSIATLVLVGMFAAVLSVLSIIEIPMPSGVPITLQTFAVALCGLVLGPRLGTMSTAIYVLLGAVGVPVFSGMSGGIGYLFGYTGGFIFGFIIMAFLCGLGTVQKNKILSGILCLAGLLSCHLLGAIQYSIVAKSSLIPSLLLVSVPYLLKDILSVAGAYVAAMAIRRALNATQLLEGNQA